MVKPVQHTNPWDFVPDQPKNAVCVGGVPTAAAPASTALVPAHAHHCDSSSGVSSTGSNAFNFAPSSTVNNGGDDWFNNADGKQARGDFLPNLSTRASNFPPQFHYYTTGLG